MTITNSTPSGAEVDIPVDLITVTIDGVEHVLSPIAQFRNTQNLIVMPMTIQGKKDIVYINDPFGAVFRVWMVTAADISAIKQN